VIDFRLGRLQLGVNREYGGMLRGIACQQILTLLLEIRTPGLRLHRALQQGGGLFAQIDRAVAGAIRIEAVLGGLQLRFQFRQLRFEEMNGVFGLLRLAQHILPHILSADSIQNGAGPLRIRAVERRADHIRLLALFRNRQVLLQFLDGREARRPAQLEGGT
jgi:hypothetical protein